MRLLIVFLILIAGGLGLACLGGVFTGKNEVIANDKRITDQAALIVPARRQGRAPSRSQRQSPRTPAFETPQDLSLGLAATLSLQSPTSVSPGLEGLRY
jgi:hypothetical protein